MAVFFGAVQSSFIVLLFLSGLAGFRKARQGVGGQRNLQVAHCKAVEQVMQDAYVSAYIHLDQFAGQARFSTWLTKAVTY